MGCSLRLRALKTLYLSIRRSTHWPSVLYWRLSDFYFAQELNFLWQSINFFFIVLGIYNFAWSMEAKGIGVCKKRNKCNQEPSHVFWMTYECTMKYSQYVLYQLLHIVLGTLEYIGWISQNRLVECRSGVSETKSVSLHLCVHKWKIVYTYTCITWFPLAQFPPTWILAYASMY